MRYLGLPINPQDGEAYDRVDEYNGPMMTARCVAEQHSLDLKQPVGVVLVDDWGNILGAGANGSRFHDEHGCERKRLGSKSGEGYELCEGCSPHNHAEAKALDSARARGNIESVRGSSAFMWGHWWACQACIDKLRAAGVRRIVLLDRADELFKVPT